uniref:ADP-ribosyl cyclase/cyclic ADP-ribose hydrolase n=2 Tax=Quercus lobata TaxID=97700 RepID=A0A7N2MG28_QUELO
MDIQDVDEGVFIIKKRLHCKKILLILDDVDDLKQLEKLAGGHNWFGPGSRIVITTRNKSLLVTHDVNEIYDVGALNNGEALQLFSLKAFGKGHPDVDYMELSQDFIRYSHGLPLALELLGSSLLKKNKIFWKDYLELVPEYGLETLSGKALIKLKGNHLWMHDLLQEMGWDIVHQECPNIPLRRSRLWLYKDIEDALEINKETEEIQGIVLKLFNPKVAHWNLKSFSKMHCLKTLIIDNVDLKNDLKSLPSGLRFLDWSGYPSKLFPSSFRTKSFERLKAIKLNKSPKLIKTPNFTDFPVLEELELKDCINLLDLHPSIGVHKQLTLLNLKGCKNLKSLPRKLEMESLEILILSECSKVKSILEFRENMKSVSKFYLDGTAIIKLPTSIGNLMGLVLLNVKDCKNLMTLPSTFLNLNSLEKLYISGCSKLLKIWGATESLEGLDEIRTAKKLKKLFISGVKRSTNPLDLSITSLSSLCSLSKLETLELSYCNLNAIPNAIGCLSTLEILILRGNNFGSFMQRSPDPLEMLLTSLSEGSCSLNKLDLSYCNLNAIPNAIGCLSTSENLILSGNNFGSFMQRSPDPLEMLLTSLSEGSCSLNKLDLSYCNLNGFSDRIGCLPSLEELILSGNKFGYLPESIAQLSNLLVLDLKDCSSLRSLPKLPYRKVSRPLLDSLPKSQYQQRPVPLINGLRIGISIAYPTKERIKLALNQDFIADIYGLSLGVVNPQPTRVFGSEIPEWFALQNIGAEINIKVPSHLCDELAGIASCGVICCRQPIDLLQLDSYLICNGNIIGAHLAMCPVLQDLSDRLLLVYFPRATRTWKIFVVNGFAKFGIRFRVHGSGMEVKECGIHLVYKKEVESFQENRNQIWAEREKRAIEYMGRAERTERRKKQREKDIAEIKRLMAKSQRSNNSIILYEGSNDCNGAGPSGEGSSNDVPHPKQIERLPELAHGDSDSEGSSEYHEWGDELHDWEESSESDQEG